MAADEMVAGGTGAETGEDVQPLGTCAVGSHRSPAAEQHREPHPYNWRACFRWEPVEAVVFGRDAR